MYLSGASNSENAGSAVAMSHTYLIESTAVEVLRILVANVMVYKMTQTQTVLIQALTSGAKTISSSHVVLTSGVLPKYYHIRSNNSTILSAAFLARRCEDCTWTLRTSQILNLKLKTKQLEALRAVVRQKRDVLAVLPTGYGKSLIYQLLPSMFNFLVYCNYCVGIDRSDVGAR